MSVWQLLSADPCSWLRVILQDVQVGLQKPSSTYQHLSALESSPRRACSPRRAGSKRHSKSAAAGEGGLLSAPKAGPRICLGRDMAPHSDPATPPLGALRVARLPGSLPVASPQAPKRRIAGRVSFPPRCRSPLRGLPASPGRGCTRGSDGLLPLREAIPCSGTAEFCGASAKQSNTCDDRAKPRPSSRSRRCSPRSSSPGWSGRPPRSRPERGGEHSRRWSRARLPPDPRRGCACPQMFGHLATWGRWESESGANGAVREGDSNDV